MNLEQRVRQSFIDQAAICGKLGSSFMETLLTGLAEVLDESTKTGARILKWQGDPAPEKDALALRLAGALHALVRRGDIPALLPFYRGEKQIEKSEFIALVLQAIVERDAEISPWLDFAPQTNEVARSSVIFAGLSELSARYKLPMALYELGSSGGLNLQTAEYGYRFAGNIYGNAESTLQLTPDWEGPLPPQSAPQIFSRRGCDLNPLSVDEPADREKLVAYLWPDQPARIKRVENAIEIARKDPPIIDRADAASWVEKNFSEPGENDILRVLFHTIAWNYFPEETKNRITTAMNAAGRDATEKCPLAWLSFEFEEETRPALTVQTWPGGEVHVLGVADPHVYGIKWFGYG